MGVGQGRVVFRYIWSIYGVCVLSVRYELRIVAEGCCSVGCSVG